MTHERITCCFPDRTFPAQRRCFRTKHACCDSVSFSSFVLNSCGWNNGFCKYVKLFGIQCSVQFKQLETKLWINSKISYLYQIFPVRRVLLQSTKQSFINLEFTLVCTVLPGNKLALSPLLSFNLPIEREIRERARIRENEKPDFCGWTTIRFSRRENRIVKHV